MSKDEDLEEFLGKLGKKERPKIPEYFDEVVYDLEGNRKTIRTRIADLIMGAKKLEKWHPENAEDLNAKRIFMNSYTERMKESGYWKEIEVLLGRKKEEKTKKKKDNNGQ